jgi:hypothetical protein
MEHDVDLVFAERALHERLLADVPAHEAYAVDELAAEELTLRNPIAHQTDNVCARLDEAANEPSAKEPGRAGDECRPVAPERWADGTRRGRPRS